MCDYKMSYTNLSPVFPSTTVGLFSGVYIEARGELWEPMSSSRLHDGLLERKEQDKDCERVVSFKVDYESSRISVILMKFSGLKER